MMEDYEQEMTDGFRTAAIDAAYRSNLAFRPEFISNDPSSGKKVLVSLEEELGACEEFKISVAFITMSGIAPLLELLWELEEKHIPGQILTTDYLTFSEPKALEKLSSLSNISLRMFVTNEENAGFHTKGYIFRRDGLFRIIIGSSNMTLAAVTTNREWNTKIISTEQGEIAAGVLREFDELWTSPKTLEYSEFIEDYSLRYRKEQMIKKQRREALSEPEVSLDRYLLTPNSMQVAFVQSILKLREENASKALLTSSTGTGKTYASAFAMRELNPKRMLFIVHREQIAKQAMKSYQRIFGSSRTYGLLSGNQKDLDAECMFSTMQMMARKDIYSHFPADAFDVIVLDECHHAGAESYQRIMSYFKPKFWLGMTASPDTNNYDIYDLFDHNIAYEIRLQQALEENLLCPFHYFGITDLEIDGQIFDDNSGVRNFTRLVSDERVDYVLKKAEYFGYSGERVIGLVFCSRKEEAKELSDKFNLRFKPDGTPYRTAVLTGEDSQARREQVIYALSEETDPELRLDYIFTVDIFNEGVDIPEINQVIMLRPTESPVVFIQQLGRGLRKFEGKEYVIILDFIGNYMNNFMIPIALSGDRSYNKDAMRRYIREGTRIIPGSSTIHFDEISRKRIYASIDSARTNDMKLLRDGYLALKYKLGRIPDLMDFKAHGSVEVTKIFDKCGSYYAFLRKYEPDYTVRLSESEAEIIEYLSRKLVSYKRIQEAFLLSALISAGDLRAFSYYRALIQAKYGITVSERIEESVIRNLTNEFPKEEERKKYRDCVLIAVSGDGEVSLAPPFRDMLHNPEFSAMVSELLELSRDRYETLYSGSYRDTDFRLYQKYNYEDVCRLLGWKRNMNAQNIGGYFYIRIRRPCRYSLTTRRHRMQSHTKTVSFRRTV